MNFTASTTPAVFSWSCGFLNQPGAVVEKTGGAYSSSVEANQAQNQGSVISQNGVLTWASTSATPLVSTGSFTTTGQGVIQLGFPNGYFGQGANTFNSQTVIGNGIWVTGVLNGSVVVPAGVTLNAGETTYVDLGEAVVAASVSGSGTLDIDGSADLTGPVTGQVTLAAQGISICSNGCGQSAQATLATDLTVPTVNIGPFTTLAPKANGTATQIGNTTVTIENNGVLTITPGMVLKATSSSAYFLVDGSLVADGTSNEEITVTSINDNTVGGVTGSGDPQPDDWTGIFLNSSGSLNLQYVTLDYAFAAVNSTTDGNVTLENDVFAHNDDAITITATTGTNAAIHDDWFDQNSSALNGTSDWWPLTVDDLPLCQFIPTIDAGDNYYGVGRSPTPFFSQSESNAIQSDLGTGDEEYPTLWTDGIQVGATDQINFWTEPCDSYDDGDLLPDTFVASPFDLNS